MASNTGMLPGLEDEALTTLYQSLRQQLKEFDPYF